MPRKTKENVEENSVKVEKKALSTSKKVTSTPPTPKIANKSEKKASTKKKTTTKKSTAIKKETAKVSQKKALSEPIMEYYDLPYRYNQTIVKILAQTPKCLFIYWDIADEDRQNLETTYGSNFFEITKPVLIVHNETMHYQFEVEINDFANSWYLPIQDASCQYHIELVRKKISSQPSFTEYVPISTSNKIDAPNDHVLFEKFTPTVSYRNLQTNATTQKDFSYMNSKTNLSSIEKLYHLVYQKELLEEFTSDSFNNPSSNFQ